MPLDELAGRLAEHERARHVGVAPGFAVARPDVDHDRLARPDLAGAAVVPDRGLRAVRDDEVVARAAVVDERLRDRRLQALRGERRAVRLPVAEEVGRDAHPRLGSPLCAAHSGELALVLDAPPLRKELPVGLELDALGTQPVGEADGEGVRHDGARQAERLDAAREDLVVDVGAAQAGADELVQPVLVEGVHDEAGELAEPRQLEGGRDHVPLTSELEVDERVANGERHLVPKRRLPQRVAVDQHAFAHVSDPTHDGPPRRAGGACPRSSSSQRLLEYA